ncbi:MAG: hypothetical protein LBB94_05655 [Clostridiales bacterium]|nr:hypothetical protein [Clostridiales bacterium]
MTEQNKVILVNGDNSKFFDQAIFIVKKNLPENKIPMDFVAEAERIIGLHLAKKRRGHDAYIRFAPEFELDMVKEELARKKRSVKIHIMLNLALLTACITLAYLLVIAR